jgi:hypothetical protein
MAPWRVPTARDLVGAAKPPSNVARVVAARPLAFIGDGATDLPCFRPVKDQAKLPGIRQRGSA